MSQFITAKGPAAIGFLVLAALTTSTGQAVAQNQEQIRQCMNSNSEFSVEVMIDACKAAMRSGKWSGASTSWIYNNLGKAEYLKQDYTAALAQYNEALRVNPNDAYALCGRGMTHNRIGNATEGEADIARSKALNASICPE